MSEVARFRPARAGIINIWNYLNDEFAFADGRLVLRGHNGAGKTKALEVLFPFVLDGRTEPRRLDPYSTDAKSMWDNLLFRGLDAAYGYTWMEFARATPEGRERVCVGVGLRAQRHTKVVKTWFFVTDKVLGTDFQLVDAESRPLSEKGLREAIGDNDVLETPPEYRERIDKRLFGLGDRYDGMISLCLMLRKPKIGDGLDPIALSQLLSLGLRPLDDELLDQAARSFEDLETVQRELDHLNNAHRELDAFLGGYRGYVRAQARHRVDQALKAMDAVAQHEHAVRQLTLAVEQAGKAVARSEATLTEVRSKLAAERARRDALKDSQAFKAAGQLNDLENHVRDATAVEQTTSKEHEHAAEAVRELRDQAREASEHLRAARTEVASAAALVRVAAQTGGVEWVDATPSEDVADVKRRLNVGTASRRQDLAHVQLFMAKAAEATHALVQAERAHTEAGAEHERAREDLERREAASVAAHASLVDELGRWSLARPAGLLDEEDLPSVVAAVARLGEDDAPTLAAVLGRRLEGRRQQLSVNLADVDRELAQNERARLDLKAQREAILAEREDAPAGWPARPAPRAERPGAPLWRLVRFRAGLDPATQAGVEAALEGAGLLDAWVLPSGDVPEPGVLDAFLVTDTGRAAGPTLADVLEAEDDTGVSRTCITALLLSIGLGASGLVRVGEAGTFQLGPLAGAYSKVAPQFIGATARAEHRRQRLASLELELRALADGRRALEGRREEILERIAAFARAVTELPTSADVFTAVRAEQQARIVLRSAREAESAAGEAVSRARRTLADAQARLVREAAARRLPTSAEEFATVSEAVERCARDGETLVGLLRLLAVRTNIHERAQRLLESRLADVRRMEATLQEQRQQRESLEVRLATLRSTRGVEIEAVLKSVSEAEANIRSWSGYDTVAEGARTAAVGAEAGAKANLKAAERTVDDAQKALAEALGRTLPFARAELAAVLEIPSADAERALAHASRPSDGAIVAAFAGLVEVLDAATRAVSATEERRKAATTVVQNGFQTLIARLGAQFRPEMSFDDEIVSVTIADDEGVHAVATFTARLETTRHEQQALLTVKEQEVFEDTLLGALCRQIHTRTLSARELVKHMDRAMRARQMMSSKMTLGIRWDLINELTKEQRDTLRLLEHDPSHLDPERLDALRRYFSAAVKQTRAVDPSRSYREILGSVLDYRRWRHFTLLLVDPDGEATPLTRQRHAKLSTGEKAISLHMPLFAAAHAQFASGRPTCPHLIALDEAFAAIDAKGKPELLGLTVKFDLDLFLTGHELWVTHASVPAAAHYELLRVEGEHTVASLLILWDGRELHEGEEAATRLRALVPQG